MARPWKTEGLRMIGCPKRSREETDPRSHLFTMQLWSEALGDGRAEWRGQVRHVASGETRYFRDWTSLAALFLEMLSKEGDDSSSSRC